MKIINKISRSSVFLLLLLAVSCSPTEIKEPKAYMKYLADPDNGLVKEKTVAGVKIKVKYLPSEYMVYKSSDGNSLSQHAKDSLLKCYENSLTFLLNIGPAENESFDITRVNVSNYQEFAERIEKMAFEMNEWISLNVDGETIHPAITQLEAINTPEKNRNFIVVFSSEKSKKNIKINDLCFVYNDEMFDIGTNKFIFKAKDLTNIPVFKF